MFNGASNDVDIALHYNYQRSSVSHTCTIYNGASNDVDIALHYNYQRSSVSHTCTMYNSASNDVDIALLYNYQRSSVSLTMYNGASNDVDIALQCKPICYKNVLHAGMTCCNVAVSLFQSFNYSEILVSVLSAF